MPDLSYLLHADRDRFALDTNRPTMKAVVTTGNGGYDKLDYRDVPVPVIRPGEVLLKVLAAAVNNTEINTRLGWYSSSVTSGTAQLSSSDHAVEVVDGGWNTSTPFPLIQGTDCCGEVVECAEDVAHLNPGQRVLVRASMRQYGYGSLENIWMASDFDGAFAQYVRVPASEVFAVDCHWSDAELATIPCAYGTAENMVHRTGVTPTDRVLITGASGGVGSALVQLVKRLGAQVTAVVGQRKIEAIADLGADRIISRGSDLIDALGESSVDVVIDNVAGDSFGTLMKLLSRGGRYSSSGAIAGPMVALDARDLYLKDLTLIGCTSWDEPVFPNLIGYVERGEIKPLVAKTFPLQDIALAQQEFEQKAHVGKFVLVPPQPNENKV